MFYLQEHRWMLFRLFQEFRDKQVQELAELIKRIDQNLSVSGII